MLNNSNALKHGSKSGLLLRNVIGSICQNQTFFKVFTVLISRYGQWTHKKYTLLGLLTETVFSLSSSVAALRPSQGFWGFREKGYLFSGIWGEGSFIFRDLGRKWGFREQGAGG